MSSDNEAGRDLLPEFCPVCSQEIQDELARELVTAFTGTTIAVLQAGIRAQAERIEELEVWHRNQRAAIIDYQQREYAQQERIERLEAVRVAAQEHVEAYDYGSPSGYMPRLRQALAALESDAGQERPVVSSGEWKYTVRVEGQEQEPK